VTDRINSFVVVLEKDIRDDDFETIRQSVLLMRGVLTVKTNVTTPDDLVAQERAKYDLRRKIGDILWKE